MARAPLAMGIIALVFSAAALTLVTLSFVLKKISYFDAY